MGKSMKAVLRRSGRMVLAVLLACMLMNSGAATTVAFADEKPVDKTVERGAMVAASGATQGEIAGDCLSELAPAIGGALSKCGVPGAAAAGEVIGIAGGIAAGTLGALAVDSVENMTEETLELCREIDAKCDDILEELDEVQAQIVAVEQDLDASIAKVDAKVDRTNLANVLSGIDGFQTTYNGVTNKYKALVQAVQAYMQKAQDGTLEQEDADAVRVAWRNIQQFYDNASNLGSATSAQFNFVSDLEAQLQRLSPYSATQVLPSNGNLNDPTQWGQRTTVTNTLLECVHTYASDGLPFQHQVRAALEAGADRGAASLYDYLMAYMLYTTIQVQSYNADPTLSEDDRRISTLQAWQNYEEAVQKVYRGINQMWSLKRTELTSYMYAYDVDQTSKMDYLESEEHWYKDDYGNLTTHYVEKASKTSPTAASYVVGTESGALYMIRQGSDLVVDDIVTRSAAYIYPIPKQDYYNASRSKSPSSFVLMKSADELKDLTSTNAWALSDGNLVDFLTTQGGLDRGKLPALSHYSTKDKYETKIADGSFLVLDTFDMYVISQYQFTSKYQWLDISGALDKSNLGASVEDILGKDMFADYWDDYLMNQVNPDAFAFQKVMFMLKATEAPKTSWNTDFGSGGTASLSTVAYDSQGTASFSQLTSGTGATGQAQSGTALAVKVRPEEGKALSSVTLVSSSGQTLDTLYSAQDDGEEYLELIPKDSEGNSVFYFSQAYQDFTVKVEFKDGDSDVLHTVDLGSSSSQGVLMDANMDGLSLTSAHAGEQVTVYARAFTGYLVDGLTVNTTSHAAVEVTELTDASVPTPGTRAFTFVMPDADVAVTASYRSGSVAQIVDSDHGKLRFSYPTCVNKAWLYEPITFDAGEVVTVESEPDVSYYCSNIVVRPASGETVVVEPNGQQSSFVMPGSTTTISATFSALGTSPLATVESTGSGYLRFVDGNETVNVGQRAYSAGETVTVQVVPQEKSRASIEVLDYYGSSVPFEEKDNMVTFTMPSGNVTVKASFVAEHEVTFNSRGGTSVASQMVEHLQTLSRPDDPVRAGYRFDGWYLSKNTNGKPYDFSQGVEKSFTLYAKWVAEDTEDAEGSASKGDSGEESKANPQDTDGLTSTDNSKDADSSDSAKDSDKSTSELTHTGDESIAVLFGVVALCAAVCMVVAWRKNNRS